MIKPEIQHVIENDLRQTVERQAWTPDPDPLPVSPWVAMSLMQKAIRRGRRTLALQAAATLLRDAPERLWRRLGCTAAEDIGLADLHAVGIATAALGGKGLRRELGGDWKVASCVVSALSGTVKCRAADDLLMISATHPLYAHLRAAYRELTTCQLATIAVGSGPLHGRGVALWIALEGDRGAAGHSRPRSEGHAFLDALCDAGWSLSMVEVARRSFRSTGELLGPYVALLWRELPDVVHEEAEAFPPEVMVGSAPGWAYDMYTREGRAAYAEFLKTDAASAVWIRRHVAPARRLKFFGHMVFRVEGGCVDRRLRWDIGDQLRETMDNSCEEPAITDVAEIRELVRHDLPLLNNARVESLG